MGRGIIKEGWGTKEDPIKRRGCFIESGVGTTGEEEMRVYLLCLCGAVEKTGGVRFNCRIPAKAEDT
jgi:hypothetical protein